MALTSDEHIVNFELLRETKARFQKHAFVPGGDMAGGAAAPPGGAPGADPAAMGMDPAAMGGAPPGGGAPPPPPGGGGDPVMQQILQKLTTLEQAGAGGGAGGAGGAIKPKVDQNMVSLQILKLLARIADALGVPIPASEMVPGQADIQQLAQATTAGTPMPGMDPTAQVPGGGAGGQGAIPPMPGMEPSGVPGGAGPEKAGQLRPTGDAFDPRGWADAGAKLGATAGRAATLAAVLRRRAAS